MFDDVLFLNLFYKLIPRKGKKVKSKIIELKLE